MKQLLALVMIALFVPSPSGSKTCPSSLPPQVQSILAKEFAGWRVVSLDDFSAEDRGLWRRAHGKCAPGIAVGRYTGNRNEFAVLLVKIGASKRDITDQLLLFTPTAGGYKQSVVRGPEPVPRFGVISAARPGSYEAADSGHKVRTTRDSIYYEELEVGDQIYFFDGGDWYSLVLSQ